MVLTSNGGFQISNAFSSEPRWTAPGLHIDRSPCLTQSLVALGRTKLSRKLAMHKEEEQVESKPGGYVLDTTEAPSRVTVETSGDKEHQ